MTAPRSMQVPVAIGDLHAVERGPVDTPTVVLIHGFPDASCLWESVAERLAAEHHVVAYDVRGAGASDAPPGTSGYRIEALLADLEAVLDATASGRTVHLVGHDWGAIQGFAAARTPRLAARLASFTAVSAPSPEVARWWLRSVLDGPPAAGLAQVARQAGRSWYVAAFQVPVLAERLVRLTVRRSLRASGHPCPSPTVVDDAVRGLGLYRANRAPGRLRDPVGVLPAGLPVRVVTGRDDPFVSPRMFDDLRDRLGVPVTEVDGAHWLPLTHPDEVATAIRRLVAEVDAPSRGGAGERGAHRT